MRALDLDTLQLLPAARAGSATTAEIENDWLDLGSEFVDARIIARRWQAARTGPKVGPGGLPAYEELALGRGRPLRRRARSAALLRAVTGPFFLLRAGRALRVDRRAGLAVSHAVLAGAAHMRSVFRHRFPRLLCAQPASRAWRCAAAAGGRHGVDDRDRRPAAVVPVAGRILPPVPAPAQELCLTWRRLADQLPTQEGIIGAQPVEHGSRRALRLPYS